MMCSDFIYWIKHQHFQTIMQKALGVPVSVKLSTEDNARFTKLLTTTFPSSPQIDGFMFDNYGIDVEFLGLIDENNPYSV